MTRTGRLSLALWLFSAVTGGVLAGLGCSGSAAGTPAPPPPPPPLARPAPGAVVAPAAPSAPPVAPVAPAPPSFAPALAAGPAAASGPAAAPRALVDEHTHVVIAGLLRFSDPGLAGFAQGDRRDVELGRALVERGVPAAHITTLLDQQATRAAILAAVGAAAAATPLGGTLVFYYAGHGVRTAAGDIAYMAYDTLTEQPTDHPGVSVNDLYLTLAQRVAGKRVVLLGDCCHSGGLGLLAGRLGAAGASALSLTSADASNLSTGNWTYSQLLIEGLRGEPALDVNGDARVDLSELEAGVRAAMRYRERQLSGAHLSGVDPSAVVVAPRVGPARVGAQAGQFMHDRRSQVVRVNRVDGERATVRAYRYALSHDALVPLSDLSPIVTTRYPVGTELMVEWGGREWPAQVTAQQGDFAFVTYPGWPHYWDEWILDDRVRSVTRLAP